MVTPLLQADASGVNIIPADLEEFYKSEEQIDMESFIAEMGESINQASISVYRVPLNPRTGLAMKRQMPFLFSCGVEEYTFPQLCELIRDKHGTGMYKLMIRDGQNILRRNRNISVEAAIDETPKPEIGGAMNGGFLTEFTNALAMQQDRLDTFVNQNQRPGILDNPQVMIALITAAGTLFAGLLGKSNEPQKSTLENLTELMMTKRAFGELMTDEDGMGGNANFWSAMTEMSKSVGPIIAGAMDAAKTDGTLDASGVIQKRPIPLPAPDKVVATQEQETMQLKQMKDNLDFLLVQVKAKIAPEEVIEFVIDRMPEDQEAFDAAANSLESFLKQPSCISQCAVIRGEINEYKDWFETWRVAMLAKLAAMSDDAGSEAGDRESTEIDSDASAGASEAVVAIDGDTKRDSGD